MKRSRRSPQTLFSSSWWVSTAIALALLIIVSGMVQAQGASDEGVMEVVVLPAGSLVSAPEPMPMAVRPAFPGTLTAVIAFIESSAQDGSLEVMRMTLGVSDERGTASGWDVLLIVAPPFGSGQPSILLANRTDSIQSTLPESATQSQHMRGVVSGMTLGPFTWPILVLHANPSNGVGVYSQDMLLGFSEVTGVRSERLYVQMAVAP